jgi:hypothetical protein
VRPLCDGQTCAEGFRFHGMAVNDGWSPTGTCPGGAKAFPLRACGARPSAGRPSGGKTGPCGASPGMARKAVFSEGRTLCVRLSMAKRVPRDSVFTGWPDDEPVAQGPHASVKPDAFLCGRAEPAPPGEAIESEVASRGKARGWRERRFSRRDALCASAWHGQTCAEEFPFHGMARRGRVAHGDMPRVEPIPFPRACGARPSAGWTIRARWPCGASPEITRKAVFSEGRTLCVRVARPRECQDIAFPPGAFTIAPQSKRGMLGLARCFPLRACGARPSRRGDRKRGGLAGEGPEMARKAVFSEGRTLCVRMVWPNVCRGIPFSRDGRAGPGRPRGHARMEPRQS